MISKKQNLPAWFSWSIFVSVHIIYMVHGNATKNIGQVLFFFLGWLHLSSLNTGSKDSQFDWGHVGAVLFLAVKDRLEDETTHQVNDSKKFQRGSVR